MTTEQPRLLRASVLAPVPALAIVALICAIGFMLFDSAGPDDSPVRAAAAILLLSPVWYLLLSGALYLAGRALWNRGVLSPRRLTVASCGIAVMFGGFVAMRTAFGFLDAVISFVAYALISAMVLLPTVRLWWRLAVSSP
jgi:hypothetical protein